MGRIHLKSDSGAGNVGNETPLLEMHRIIARHFIGSRCRDENLRTGGKMQLGRALLESLFDKIFNRFPRAQYDPFGKGHQGSSGEKLIKKIPSQHKEYAEHRSHYGNGHSSIACGRDARSS